MTGDEAITFAVLFGARVEQRQGYWRCSHKGIASHAGTPETAARYWLVITEKIDPVTHELKSLHVAQAESEP